MLNNLNSVLFEGVVNHYSINKENSISFIVESNRYVPDTVLDGNNPAKREDSYGKIVTKIMVFAYGNLSKRMNKLFSETIGAGKPIVVRVVGRLAQMTKGSIGEAFIVAEHIEVKAGTSVVQSDTEV
jgi:hypothetical protein